jgi:BirA family biotin operon repressor/biotin-[acetyl-CoA-carboxylase] ligase
MHPIGEPFIELTDTESTNIYAMQKAHARLAKHGTAYFAHSQTAGKGQRGNSWQSEPGQNLILSVVLEPDFLKPTASFILSITVSLACHDFVSQICGDETAIKWPNDLYWRDRKAGGILVENQVKGSRWVYAIVGIGINVNQVNFSPALPNPVSLRQITGQQFDPVSLSHTLCHHLQTRYVLLQAGKSALLLEEYNHRLFGTNRSLLFKSGNLLFRGTIREVTAAGEIVIETDRRKSYQFGEIEWIREP